MKFKNFDEIGKNKKKENFNQLYDFMPDRCFRMLITGPSGCGKTNTLVNMLVEPLVYYDKIYLYSKNLEQDKYEYLHERIDPISKEAGYQIIEESNDQILPVSSLSKVNQKLVIFDDFVCEKNQNPLIEYFIMSRHKNCNVIYLSQSYYKTPKDIRNNCTHFCVFDFPSRREKSMICSDTQVPKEVYEKATFDPYSFLYIDKPRKFVSKNFDEKI